MGDRTSVAIEIGGKLDRALIGELIEAAASDWACPEWDGENLTEADVIECATDGHAVYLVSNECNYAHLDALEDFCGRHALFFRKEWEAGGSYPCAGELVDAGGSVNYALGAIGESPAICVDDIRKLLVSGDLGLHMDRLVAPVPPLALV